MNLLTKPIDRHHDIHGKSYLTPSIFDAGAEEAGESR